MGKGYGFLIRFFSFTVWSNFTQETCRRLREFVEIRKSLREFEEIEISRQNHRGDCVKSKEENSLDFVWISSKK
jgi:hypothetical protein